MSTITLEGIEAAQVQESEQASNERSWVAQAPLVTLAACTTAFLLFLDSKRAA
ncbi:hypothetical protein [Corynebacterium sp. A21]|uniref:hypothetical protein n=1 Tax=Corynebacterium sp. A21 TaxID=3457318 RepID=UPI003FD23F3A